MLFVLQCEVTHMPQNNTHYFFQGKSCDKAFKMSPESEHFWNEVEKILKCSFPKYIKNLMSIRGFDNKISILELDNTDINDIENFVRDDLKTFLPENANPRDFYGLYENNKKNFKFLPGHIKLIFGFKTCLQNNSEDFSEKFIPYKDGSQLGSQAQIQEQKNNNKVSNKVVFAQKKENTDQQYNTIKDKNKIVELIRSWVTNQLSEQISQHSQDLQNNSSSGSSTCDAGTRILKDILKISSSDVIVTGNSAKIRCILCSKNSKKENFVSIISTSKKIGRRWIVSNFTRHVKSHANISENNFIRDRGRDADCGSSKDFKGQINIKKQISILSHVTVTPSRAPSTTFNKFPSYPKMLLENSVGSSNNLISLEELPTENSFTINDNSHFETTKTISGSISDKQCMDDSPSDSFNHLIPTKKPKLSQADLVSSHDSLQIDKDNSPKKITKFRAKFDIESRIESSIESDDEPWDEPEDEPLIGYEANLETHSGE